MRFLLPMSNFYATSIFRWPGKFYNMAGACIEFNHSPAKDHQKSIDSLHLQQHFRGCPYWHKPFLRVE
jgi:hypothetical protein